MGNRLTHNLIANFVGKIWTGLLSLICVPIYVRLLGIEAYGLVGLYASLMIIIGVLDLGLTTTLNRELARLSALPGEERTASDLVRTLELIYWAITILISGGVILLAPYVGQHWVRPQHLSPAVVTQAIMMMGLILAFQWPDSFYAGGLMGLQRQVQLNGLRAAVASVQSIGAILLLSLMARTIQAFFLWQMLVCAVQTLLLRRCVWRAMPATKSRPAFNASLVRHTWRFAAGITAVTLAGIVVTQLDKIVLSRSLSLERFGYYALACQIGGALTLITTPIFSSLFPRFAQMAATNDEANLIPIYHKACQLLSMLLFPTWILGLLYGRQLLALYLRNPYTAYQVYPVMVWVITGLSINSIMTLPAGLQWSYGWTGLSSVKTWIAAISTLPLLWYLVAHYGAVGAAAVRAVVNIGYFLIEIPIMHRRLLRTEMWRWYRVDIGLPLTVTVICALCSLPLLYAARPSGTLLAQVASLFAVTVIIVGLALPATRRYGIARWQMRAGVTPFRA